MLGIITYGSLINHQETTGMETPPVSIIPVKLSTFRRSFNQQPAWRKNRGKHSAVLNVQADEPNWFNGVCYCFYAFDFTALDNRERGYLRVAVHPDRISNYQGHSLPELEELFLYQGKREYQNDTLLPNLDYLDICLTGAKYWGEEFYRDFLDTTHINNGILLREYLQFS